MGQGKHDVTTNKALISLLAFGAPPGRCFERFLFYLYIYFLCCGVSLGESFRKRNMVCYISRLQRNNGQLLPRFFFSFHFYQLTPVATTLFSTWSG